jgi:hypothetical protein
LRGAVRWDEDQRAGLGSLFADAVEAAIDSIRDPSVTWVFYRDLEA